MTSTQQDASNQQETEEATEQLSSLSKPGELLRQAREKQGLSQEEVAQQLNFLPAYIPALEQETFDSLHSKTFIKGYIRAYARFLKIDAEEVLRSLEAHHPELSQTEKIQPIEGVKQTGKAGRFVFKLFTLLVVAALIGVIILWWQSRTLEPLPALSSQDIQVETLNGETITAPFGQAEEDFTESQKNVTSPEEPPQELAEPANDQAAAAEPATTAANESAEETASPPEPQAEPETPAAPSSRDFSGSGEEATQDNDRLLALTFTGDCWTEVRDSQDRVLHASLNRSGDRLLLEGEAPFRIVFGQGQAAAVYHQGAAVDFSSRIRANGYTFFTVE